MKRQTSLYISFALVVLVGTLNFIAVSLYLYWTLWWFDNVMHFLGGLSLGFFSIYFFYDSGFWGGKLSFSKAVILSFTTAMFVSGAWELFEYLNDYPPLFEEKYDSLHDLIADALGAILAILIVRRSLKRS